MAEKLTLKQLLSTYNEAADRLGKKQLKKFRNREQAEQRTKAILVELRDSVPAKRSKVIDWPYTGPGEGAPSHKIRNNTLNAQFVGLLKQGITRGELATVVREDDEAKAKEAQDNVDSRVQSLLRMLHTYNGYGIKETDGTLKLVVK